MSFPSLGTRVVSRSRPSLLTVDQLNAAEQDILDRKVGVSPFLIAGGQYRFRPISVFVQGTANPVNKDFLLYNGKPWNFTLEAGIRYNVGTSIDRQ